MKDKKRAGMRNWIFRSVLLSALAAAFLMVAAVVPMGKLDFYAPTQAADERIEVQLKQQYGKEGSATEHKEVGREEQDLSLWTKPSFGNRDYEVERVLIEKEKVPYSYVVQYFKDSKDGQLLGQTVGHTAFYGDVVTLSMAELDALRPSQGYLPGEQVGEAAITRQQQIVSVVYTPVQKKLQGQIDVSYLYEKAGTKEQVFLGQQSFTGDVGSEFLMDNETRNAFKEAAEQFALAPSLDGVVLEEQPFWVFSEQPIHIQVLYSSKDEATTEVMVEYFYHLPGTGGSFDLIGTDVWFGRQGETFSMDREKLNRYKQTAMERTGKQYDDGEVHGGPSSFVLTTDPVRIRVYYYLSLAQTMAEQEPTQADLLQEERNLFVTVAHAGDVPEVLSKDALRYTFEPGYRYYVTVQYRPVQKQNPPSAPDMGGQTGTTLPNGGAKPPNGGTQQKGGSALPDAVVGAPEADGSSQAAYQSSNAAKEELQPVLVQGMQAHEMEEVVAIQGEEVPGALISQEGTTRSFYSADGWALTNLLMLVLSAALTAAALVRIAKKGESTTMSREGGFSSWVAVALLSVVFVLFLLTQNPTQPMVWADGWTWLFVLLPAVQGVLFWADRFLKREGQTS